MTIKEIIKKWQTEQDRLLEKASFCSEHNFPHEKDFILERYNAIKDVLSGLTWIRRTDMGLLGRLRFMFGHCPICGGDLKCISHDCIRGDKYQCMWCKTIWVED